MRRSRIHRTAKVITAVAGFMTLMSGADIPGTRTAWAQLAQAQYAKSLAMQPRMTATYTQAGRSPGALATHLAFAEQVAGRGARVVFGRHNAW